MEQARFIGEVQRLLCCPVAGLDQEGKLALLRDQLALFQSDRSLLELQVAGSSPTAGGTRSSFSTA
jgi:hypothetical protein